MRVTREEREQYLRGFGVGAVVVESHLALNLGGVGLQVCYGLALEPRVGLAQQQGLADAALVALEGQGR